MAMKHISYEEAYGLNFQDIDARQPNVEKAKQYIDCSLDTSLEEAILKIIDYCKHGKGGREWE